MNLLIKGISISLLSLIGVDGALARPEVGGGLGPVRYGSDYPAGPSLAAHHGAGQYEANSSWPSQDEAASLIHKEPTHAGGSVRSEENRLSPEQRRALRHEIKEVGRELYRHK